MKKIGIIIFIVALAVGVVVSNFFSFGKYIGRSPVNFSFSSKIKGSGNLIAEKRNLSGFTAIDVSGAVIDVEIIAQKEFSVEVEADDNLLPLIQTEIDGQTLEIRTQKSFNSRNKIKVRITAPNIEAIENSGVSSVYLSNLSSDSLKIDSSGASSVRVKGTTRSLTVDLSGASRLEASNLIASEAKVESSGASSSDINVTKRLNADLSGASNLSYRGNPANVLKNTSGVSSITRLD